MERDGSVTIDPQRMVYVAGCRRATFSGMTIVAPGEFEYKLTLDGDGRVPHELGLLKDVLKNKKSEDEGEAEMTELILKSLEKLIKTEKNARSCQPCVPAWPTAPSLSAPTPAAPVCATAN